MSREYELKLELTEGEATRIYTMMKRCSNETVEKQIDKYYCPVSSDPKEFMQTKCIRIRMQGEKKTLDYKEIVDENSTYMQKLIEFSTGIDNENSLEEILKRLGLKKILTVQKDRTESIYKNDCKISLDKVDQLGWFIEIELLDTTLEESILENKIKSIINELGITEIRINKQGYSNMLLNLLYGE